MISVARMRYPDQRRRVHGQRRLLLSVHEPAIDGVRVDAEGLCAYEFACTFFQIEITGGTPWIRVVGRSGSEVYRRVVVRL